MLYGFNNLVNGMLIEKFGVLIYFIIVLVFIGGIVFLMWFGE